MRTGAGGRLGQVVVVDNGSVDDSRTVVAARAGVAWIETGRNLGFGRAANRGAAAGTGDDAPYVLFLNPDATLWPGALDAMAGALDERPELGVVGPVVRNPDGSVYPSARAFPSVVDALGHAFVGLVAPANRWSRRYEHPDHVDWVSGTAMLVRRSAFEAVGGFDEAYFMYVEDVDLCWRLAAAGWAADRVDGAAVTHAIGGSSERAPYRMIVAHHRSLWRFARRTRTGWRRAVLPAVAAGLATRAVAACVVRLARRHPPAVRRPANT